MQITENKLVTVQYELFVKNSNGSFELMEATTPEAPLKYMHGVGMMLPKFEEQLTGKSVGDKFEFSTCLSMSSPPTVRSTKRGSSPELSCLSSMPTATASTPR